MEERHPGELPPAVAATETQSAWNPRDLGAVALVGLGVWEFATGVGWLAQWLGAGALARDAVLAALIPVGLGIALVLLARPIANRVLSGGPEAPPADPVPLLAATIAVVGVLVVVAHAYALVRLVLPFTEYGQDEQVPAGDVAADLVVIALGVALFLRSRAIASWWSRWNRPR